MSSPGHNVMVIDDAALMRRLVTSALHRDRALVPLSSLAQPLAS